MALSKTYPKLQNTKSQCLQFFTKVFFSLLRLRKKQEIKEGKTNPNPKPSCTIEIPNDLLEEILHLLQVKSLIRFKSVSKNWKSLIESNYLAEKQLRFRQKKYGLEETQIIFEGSKKKTNLRVPGSCNGLVCVYDLVNVYLINPVTNVKRKLVPPPGTKLSVGFGRDVVTKTYKVAVLYRFLDDNNNERVDTMVFDLETSKWRWRYKTAGPMPFLSFDLTKPERNPVFLKGSLFWLLARHHILVMDLHTEKFRTISQPKEISVSSGPIYIWSLKDHLCVSDLKQGIHSYMWVLVQQDEVNEKWKRARFVRVGDTFVPPLDLNSTWYSQTLVSPYQSSSSSSNTFRF